MYKYAKFQFLIMIVCEKSPEEYLIGNTIALLVIGSVWLPTASTLLKNWATLFDTFMPTLRAYRYRDFHLN